MTEKLIGRIGMVFFLTLIIFGGTSSALLKSNATPLVYVAVFILSLLAAFFIEFGD